MSYARLGVETINGVAYRAVTAIGDSGEIVCPDGVSVGDLYIGGGFQPRAAVARGKPARALADAKAERYAALSDRRWRAERAFSFGGVTIDLDEGTQARLDAAINGMSRYGVAAVEWQVSRGVFVEFTLEQLSALGQAAFAHVQACFANAKALSLLIEAAETATAADGVDLERGWP